MRKYLRNLRFSFLGGGMLIVAGLFFILRGFLPFLPTPKQFQLYEMAVKVFGWLNEENEDRQSR
jgi:hypothetical protein